MRNLVLILLVVLFVSYLSYITFDWWFLGTKNEFSAWYNTFDFFIWIAKEISVYLFYIISLIEIVLSLYLLIYWFFKNNIRQFILKRYFIFIPYVLLSLILGEQHPFSQYPMYKEHNKNTILFYYTANGNIIPNMKISRTPSQFISKLYSTYAEKQTLNTHEGKQDSLYKYNAGSFIVDNAVIEKEIQNNSIKNLNLYMVDCTVKNCDTFLLISKNYEYLYK